MRSTNRLFLNYAIVIACCGYAPVAHAAGGPSTSRSRTPGSPATRPSTVAANVLSYQSDLGGWPKNIDTTAARTRATARTSSRPSTTGRPPTNCGSSPAIYAATEDAAYRAAFDKGLDYVLAAQYPNGGWPQSHPPGTGYHRHITFNDNAMVRLMEFLREVATADGYAFVDADRRKARRERLRPRRRVHPQVPGQGRAAS